MFIKYGGTFVLNFLLHFSFTVDPYHLLLWWLFSFPYFCLLLFVYLQFSPLPPLLRFPSSHLAVLFKHAVNSFIPQRQNQLSEQHFVSMIHLQNAYL